MPRKVIHLLVLVEIPLDYLRSQPCLTETARSIPQKARGFLRQKSVLGVMDTTDRQRVTWIDDLKIVAGLLMVLDHALLYLGDPHAWPRQTLTRGVEPLYVFAFGYLVSQRLGPLPKKRWGQLILAALAETALHSCREGHLHFGILASLALVWPLAQGITRLPAAWLLASMMLSGFLALGSFPLTGAMDYGPWLIVSQLALASACQRKISALAWLLPLTWLLQMATVGLLDAQGFAPHPNLSTLLIGHPLAVLLIAATRQPWWPSPALLRFIARYPLRFYLGHLAALALLRSGYLFLFVT